MRRKNETMFLASPHPDFRALNRVGGAYTNRACVFTLPGYGDEGTHIARGISVCVLQLLSSRTQRLLNRRGIAQGLGPTANYSTY